VQEFAGAVRGRVTRPRWRAPVRRYSSNIAHRPARNRCGGLRRVENLMEIVRPDEALMSEVKVEAPSNIGISGTGQAADVSVTGFELSSSLRHNASRGVWNGFFGATKQFRRTGTNLLCGIVFPWRILRCSHAF